MDEEKIESLAKNNARSIKRFYSINQMQDLPSLDILEINFPKVTFHTKKFPGEERYIIISGYLELVLKVFESSHLPADYINGLYYISVWDTSPEEIDYALNFCNLPDIYQMNNYDGQLGQSDPFKYEQKLDRMVFVGSSTGSHEVAKNQRLLLCNWGQRNKDIGDFCITNYIQNDLTALKNAFGDDYGAMLNGFIPKEDQFHYKFIINIDGNVASWDRLVWIMNSNSLALKFPSKEKDFLWYYPLLTPEKHFVSVSLENLRDKYEYYINHPNEAKGIIQQAQTFVRTYLTPQVHIYYTSILLSNVKTS